MRPLWPDPSLAMRTVLYRTLTVIAVTLDIRIRKIQPQRLTIPSPPVPGGQYSPSLRGQLGLPSCLHLSAIVNTEPGR